MTAVEAATILRDFYREDDHPYAHVNGFDKCARLNGKFSAQQLRAFAELIEQPRAVSDELHRIKA